MADEKPFSEEQMQWLQDWVDGKLPSYPLGHDANEEALILVRGFLSTIEEYEKALDSAMRQVSALNKVNIADRKRITAQIAMIEKMKTAIHDCIERPKGVVPDSAVEFYDMRGLGINEKPRKILVDQTAEIERLRGALTRIAVFDDKGGNDYLEKYGKYGAFDEPGSVETARQALNERSE